MGLSAFIALWLIPVAATLLGFIACVGIAVRMRKRGQAVTSVEVRFLGYGIKITLSEPKD